MVHYQVGDHGRGAPEQPQLLDGCLVGDVGHDGDGALVQSQPEVGVRSVQHRRPVRHHGEGLDEGDGELPGENKSILNILVKIILLILRLCILSDKIPRAVRVG